MIFRPGEPEARLEAELERFSFGAAVSPLAEVTPFDGPDNFVRTVVTLGGISIDHAQHPATGQQNITASGPDVPDRIAHVHFIYDSGGHFLMAGFGPPAAPEITTELADTVKAFNDNFDASQTGT